MTTTLDVNAQTPEAEQTIPEGYEPALYKMRHSAAHVMAQAVRERFAEGGPRLPRRRPAH